MHAFNARNGDEARRIADACIAGSVLDPETAKRFIDAIQKARG